MRILHTSDWQLGMTRHYLAGEAQPRFTADRVDTVRTLLALALERECSFVVVLLIFILQNMEDATIHFMSWTSSMPTGVAMLLAAIAGALVMALVGSVRLFAVNRRVRKLEKERERIKSTLR